MTKEEILKADLLDILFESRNKTYGAYNLRKYYNNRLSIALATSLLGALLVFLIIRPGNNKSSFLPIANDQDSVVLIDLVDPPEQPPIDEPQPEPQRQKPLETPASIDYSTITIVDDRLVTDVLPTQDDITDKMISNVNADGPAATEIVLPKVENPGSGNTEEDVEEPKIYDSNNVDAKPEFPGGMDALRNFLSRYLRHPNELEANEIRTVYVKFVVSTDGAVTDYQVIRSAGNNFDNEVLRVLKKMPKWKPAKLGGKNVAVTFTQPVTFKGLED